MRSRPGHLHLSRPPRARLVTTGATVGRPVTGVVSRAHARSNRQHLYTVAEAYYLGGETMAAIAGRLDVSRSTVSRLLAQAREEGVVRISLDPAARMAGHGAERLGRRFGVRAHVVDVRDSATDVTRLDRVATAAGRLLADWVTDGTTIGLAWGNTVGAVADRVPPTPRRGCHVVQLNGAANEHTTGIAYAGEILTRTARAFDAIPHHFPVPAFFDDARTKELLWRERSIASILALQAGVDIAVFGLGATTGAVRSHVYAGGYLTETDLRELTQQGVVGDVCTVFLRADGTYADIALNARGSGPTPRDLARIPRRLCVVAGPAKAAGALAALNAGVVTDLVVDSGTVARLLDTERMVSRARRPEPGPPAS